LMGFALREVEIMKREFELQSSQPISAPMKQTRVPAPQPAASGLPTSRHLSNIQAEDERPCFGGGVYAR
jgi:hypothetical protein